METSNVSHLLIISISLLIFSRIGTFNNQCNHLSVLHDGKPERLLLAESEKRVWTERKRQRDVSISDDNPALGGPGRGGVGWESGARTCLLACKCGYRNETLHEFRHVLHACMHTGHSRSWKKTRKERKIDDRRYPPANSFVSFASFGPLHDPYPASRSCGAHLCVTRGFSFYFLEPRSPCSPISHTPTGMCEMQGG